jgi:hypothetical protein
MKLISEIKSLLIGLWLGASVFFIGVAQSAFTVIPTRDVAGALVSRTLAIVNITGILIGLVLLGLSFLDRKTLYRKAIWIERALIFILVLACAVGQFVIALWMSYLRGLMGRPIDEVALTDPLRIQFNALHQYSVWVLMVGMVTAFVLFFISARLGRSTGNPDISESL